MRSHNEPRQSKKLSQVFLRTDWPVQRVATKVHAWGARRVLEIGPGKGILTKALANAGLKVTAVEKDTRFFEYLNDQLRAGDLADSESLIRVVNADILDFDLGAWCGATKEPAAVVGNIPYNISSPILLWVLPHLSHLSGAMFLTQLEFAQRLAAEPGGKTYGSLSVFSQLRSRVEFECKVPASCFTPVPKVDSALVALRPIKQNVPDALLHRTEVITRAAFTQRRKKLRNAVRAFTPEDAVADCPIDLNRRPETLTPQEFVELAAYLTAKAKK